MSDNTITAVSTPGQGGRRYQTGQGGLIRFEEVQKGGQMGYVPWIRAHYEDGSTKELNVALVEYVDREASK